MKPRHFIDQLDDARIVAAIAAAEQKTSGEIRVYISRRKPSDPLVAARTRFLALGMHQTRERNAVLIYLVPQAHQFALWADRAIHEKCGADFWAELTASMTPLFQQGELTRAVEHAVEQIGQALARHFPRLPDDTNELPDDVARD